LFLSRNDTLILMPKAMYWWKVNGYPFPRDGKNAGTQDVSPSNAKNGSIIEPSQSDDTDDLTPPGRDANEPPIFVDLGDLSSNASADSIDALFAACANPTGPPIPPAAAS